MAAIELFLFIVAYQKEMLNVLEKNSVYSLRYHHRNNDLCYKNKNKSITKYFFEESKSIGKNIIEQTGMYFDIKPYKSIRGFTSSEEWLVLNSKYKYFIRTDYKACFDSIYTHTFTWLIGKNVNDTKIKQKKEEDDREKIIKAYLFKENTFYLTKRSLMNQFNELICLNEENNPYDVPEDIASGADHIFHNEVQ